MCGKMMRMRGFAGDSEWSGKWSDKDSSWTSQLRNMLNYRDASDGTFWMSYDDFVKYFTDLLLVRMADDSWSRFSVKSQWVDSSAGGGPHLISWRTNYQWLLTVTKPDTRFIAEVTLPSSTSYTQPIGLVVVSANGGADGKRRKLFFDRGELHAEVEPHVGRRVSLECTLQPAAYLLVPYMLNAGAESRFSLNILSDDTDDDRKPDFGFEPIRPATDWYVTRVQAPWKQAAAPPGSDGFGNNLQVQIQLSGEASQGRVFVFVETLGANADGRTHAGLQEAPSYPPIGVAIVPGAGSSAAAVSALPAKAVSAEVARRDGVWVEARLNVAQAHVVIPYLGEGGEQELRGNEQLALTIYSDVPHSLDQKEPDKFWCAWCDGEIELPGKKTKCPYNHVIMKMDRLSAIMDQRIAFLDEALDYEP